MPLDTCFSLLGKAKDIVVIIMERLEQLELSDSIVKRLQENLGYMKLTIEKIEPHLQKDSNTAEIATFLTHLENANKSCEDIAKMHIIVKFVKAPAILNKLYHVETELQYANSRLVLFITSSHLTKFCDTACLQNMKLTKVDNLTENNMAGLSIVTNKAVKPPPPPLGFTIQEDKNEFILSWQPSEGKVVEYEVCYNVHDNSTIRVQNATEIKIGPPRVCPGNLYSMKVRGINEGGAGEWSVERVGQFRKPLPQKPSISNLLLRSTMASVTINIPEKICKTESPAVYVEVAYISETSMSWSEHKFVIINKLTYEDDSKPKTENHTFTVSGLHPNTKYNFSVKTMNAEGWSEPSNLREGYTLELPPKPFKPKIPIIKAATSSKVNVRVEMPKNTSGETSPIVAWSLSGYTADKVKIERNYKLDETEFMDDSHDLAMAGLDPNQQYTLQLLAKNENGWSEPSKEFTVHIAKPSTPINVRVSSLRSHSVIKIRWNAPDSTTLISYYEITKRRRKGRYTETPIRVPANKFSATFKNLSQNTKYCFKICSCNGFRKSEWSEEVETNTRIHKAIKAALSPAVWAIGTVTAPITMPLGAGIAGGQKGGEAAGTAGTIGGAVGGTLGGAALGTVGAPLVGATWAHMFVHGIDGLQLSDQSDDENAVIINS